jgi:hypothetical protein
VFETLNSINVNGHTEKKNGLTYLSWAWAWAEVKKAYPNATYTVYENDGWNYFSDGHTCWVKTGVTIEGLEHIEYLPVMDYNNRSIPLEKVTSTDVNKSIQRSLTKACARHGLGLYIYAGEDLPENATGTDDSTAASTATVPAPTTAEVKPKKATTTRKGRTVQQPTQPANDRYAGIKAAIAAMQDTNSLLALYNQHKNEVEGNEAIKALFTLRKYELQQAA